MGFEEPPDDSSNYQRTYQLSGEDKELLDIADTAVEVLAKVYRIGERSDIEIQLELG